MKRWHHSRVHLCGAYAAIYLGQLVNPCERDGSVYTTSVFNILRHCKTAFRVVAPLHLTNFIKAVIFF
jgi:hypothetical protein